jgi:hypothetical protein
VLEDLLRVGGRQHLEEFTHNGDLIGPGHGTADEISRCIQGTRGQTGR